MANRTAAERIAESTWNRLGESWRLHARLGEETLTDLLVLDFLPSALRYNVKVFQTTKHKEAVQGTDLEVWVRCDDNTADIYTIQAKKLHEGRYNCLNVRSGNSRQINILEDYARTLRAMPLYLLFNHVDGKSGGTPHWHCCQQPMDKKQFGCTLVPSWRIREAISKRGCRTFDYIHSDQAALPWRCAFDCPNSQTTWGRIREKAKESYRERSSENLFSPEDAGPEIGKARQKTLPLFSTFHDLYGGMNFEDGVGEWPSALWGRETFFLSADDLSLLYRGSIDEGADGFLRYPPAPPRWLILVNSDDS